MMVATGMYELGVAWALRQPKSHMIELLANASRELGMYYGTPLQVVLAKVASHAWTKSLHGRAKIMDAAVSMETLYQCFRKYKTVVEATVSAFCECAKFDRHGKDLMQDGFTMAVIVLAIACIDAHVFPEAAATESQIDAAPGNTWQRSMVFDKIATPPL